MKVVFCTPTVTRPYAPYLSSLEASIPLIQQAGIEEASVFEIGNPYISAARATMTRKALDAKADAIVYIDHDLSWRPEDLLQLVQTEGDVVCGTYRFKHEPEEYMGTIYGDARGCPIVRADGCIKAKTVPAGFLKVTAGAIDKFMTAYPELIYGPQYNPSIDLFNHGARNRLWWGEDYAFSDRWNEKCGDIWLIPDLNLDHHTSDAVFKGNYHRFLLRQPGGSESDCPNPEFAHG